MVVFLQGGKRSFFTSQVQRTFNQKTPPKKKKKNLIEKIAFKV
jgi:hypothetical protein